MQAPPVPIYRPEPEEFEGSDGSPAEVPPLRLPPIPGELPLPTDDIPGMQALHHDIVRFVERVAPMKEEADLRADIMDTIRHAALEVWPSAEVIVYGSMAHFLYLPDSDMDVAVQGTNVSGNLATLNDFAEKLQHIGEATVLPAKVPVVKLLVPSGLVINICFDAEGVMENLLLVQDAMQTHPDMIPLVLLMKTFLRQRQLNQVFTGGLSSHAMMLMIISFLRGRPKADEMLLMRQNVEALGNCILGLRFVQLLKYYGLDFDYTQAVSVRNGGSVIPKLALGWLEPAQPFAVAVEDPVSLVNVARPTLAYPTIQRHLVLSCQALITAVNTPPAVRTWPSFLHLVIAPHMYDRPVRGLDMSPIVRPTASRPVGPVGPVVLPMRSPSTHSRNSAMGSSPRTARSEQNEGEIAISIMDDDENPCPDLSPREDELSDGGVDEETSHHEVTSLPLGKTPMTFMIRNIPNKFSQKSLLSVIDEHFKGTYDFFYLPIDFKNQCNLGYAFINFMKPEAVQAFINEFHNKTWSAFNSRKVCQIANARIQGKLALIAHFQNSTLMKKEGKCRPLIFYSTGPKTGDAEPFPAPSGYSRQRRPVRRVPPTPERRGRDPMSPRRGMPVGPGVPGPLLSPHAAGLGIVPMVLPIPAHPSVPPLRGLPGAFTLASPMSSPRDPSLNIVSPRGSSHSPRGDGYAPSPRQVLGLSPRSGSGPSNPSSPRDHSGHATLPVPEARPSPRTAHNANWAAYRHLTGFDS